MHKRRAHTPAPGPSGAACGPVDSGDTTSAPVVPRYSRNCRAKCTDDGTPRAKRAWLEEEWAGPGVEADVPAAGVQDTGTYPLYTRAHTSRCRAVQDAGSLPNCHTHLAEAGEQGTR